MKRFPKNSLETWVFENRISAKQGEITRSLALRNYKNLRFKFNLAMNN